MAIFGPGRCMFGSNFPVEKLWTSHARLVEVFDTCLTGRSDAERDDILTNPATRRCRLERRTSGSAGGR